MPDFQLDGRLARDCRQLGDWPLCRVLLMNDANYPWFILMPRRANIREIYQVSDPDRAQLWEGSAQLSPAAMRAFDGFKLNVAALGNAVRELHVQHIVRRQDDRLRTHPGGNILERRRRVLYHATDSSVANSTLLHTRLPWPAPSDLFGLVDPDDRLCERVLVRIAGAADGSTPTWASRSV